MKLTCLVALREKDCDYSPLWRSLQRQLPGRHTWELLVAAPAAMTLPPRPSQELEKLRVVGLPGRHTTTRAAMLNVASGFAAGEAVLLADPAGQLLPGAVQQLGDLLRAADVAVLQEATLGDSGEPLAPAPDLGWRTSQAYVYGRPVTVPRPFPLTPAALRLSATTCQRPVAIRAKTYRAIGGHDPQCPALEDHQLLLRLYGYGARWNVSQELGYVGPARPDPEPKLYFQTQLQAYRRFFSAALHRWLRDRKRQPLNLWDLHRRDWRFAGSLPCSLDSQAVIDCYDYLPLLLPDQLVPFWNACWDALEPGGYLRCRVPSTDGRAAFSDPRFRSYHNQASFLYWTDHRYARLIPQSRARFQLLHLEDRFLKPEDEQQRLAYTFCDLCALKGQHQPGPVRI